VDRPPKQLGVRPLGKTTLYWTEDKREQVRELLDEIRVERLENEEISTIWNHDFIYVDLRFTDQIVRHLLANIHEYAVDALVIAHQN